MLGEEFGDLEVVDLGDFEEGGGEFGLCGEAGLVDVLAGGFEFFGYVGYGEACAEECPDGFLALAEGGCAAQISTPVNKIMFTNI